MLLLHWFAATALVCCYCIGLLQLARVFLSSCMRLLAPVVKVCNSRLGRSGQRRLTGSAEDCRAIFDVNVLGTMRMTSAFLPLLRRPKASPEAPYRWPLNWPLEAKGKPCRAPCLWHRLSQGGRSAGSAAPLPRGLISDLLSSLFRCFTPWDPTGSTRGGRVINVGSALGRVGVFGQAAYCSSKFAIRGWSEALRQELEVKRVDVVLIGTSELPEKKRTNKNATPFGGVGG
eukprot:GHVT01097558.1.p1 GENE.GHVT01097558.1~~GHVT01097558.1.p1  ORF type:complete len:231 (+),score=24.26 GHVT01097558.1:201-893(+)